MIPTWDWAQSFYKGMNPVVKVNIDVAAGGTIMSKTPKDALYLFEEMDNTQSLWSNERAMPRKGKTLDVNGLTMVKC